MHGVGTFLELLEMPLVHRAAKSQVIFFELVHNGSFWHELSATPEPFPGANYIPAGMRLRANLPEDHMKKCLKLETG